jgi:hypothetical protein
LTSRMFVRSRSLTRSTVQKKPYKPTEIVLRNVTRYAYAEMADRTYAIWALGEAGYFEIQPAAQYKVIFDDMVQAVEILYFVTDVYNEPRKKGGGPTANLIYQEVGGRDVIAVAQN